MARFRVGVQFHPQHCTIEDLRAGWREADRMGVDTIWTWDHFFPLYGEPEGAHFEGWTLLAAMACDTDNAQFGMLVTCNSYRNPELVADIARTVDHLGGGRLILGIGAGWFQKDYEEYGYEFGEARDRLRALGESLPRIKRRIARLNPPPKGNLPILIGGGGEKVTLRLVAEYADIWNGFGGPEEVRHKNDVLNRWCEKSGRDPQAIERSTTIDDPSGVDVDGLINAGAQHLIVGRGAPFDLAPVRQLLEEARS